MNEGTLRSSNEKIPLPESKWFSPKEIESMRYACDCNKGGWIRDSHTLLHVIRNSPKVQEILLYWGREDKEMYIQILNEIGFTAGFQLARSDDFEALIEDLDDFLEGYVVPEDENPEV